MRLLYAILALLAPLLIVQAQDIAPATAPDLGPTVSDTSLLWRISGPEVTEPSYLFGTIHIIPTEDYFLDATVVRAINDVDEVLFEIDPGELQNPAVMMGLMNRINMQGDTALDQLLSQTQYDSVATYFETTGLPMFMVKRMKPMFLSAMVGNDLSGGNPFAGGSGDGSAKVKSYEFELSELAEAAGKPIAGLETMDFQLGLFDSIPYTVQAQMLYRSVVEEADTTLGDGDSQMDRMVEMYRSRNVAALASMITDESVDYGNFEEMLLTRRNANWAPMISERLSTTPTVYAVGAGHLGGAGGVIALLRAAGLTVEPVYP